jgi:uncharacterized protein YndB with AHSA1/START domain
VTTSHWHKLYRADIIAPPEALFDLLADLPHYGRWLPPSGQYAATTEVEPYPVHLGSRYHDGKPGGEGRGWWGTVTAFARPNALDFHHRIDVPEVRAVVDVNIHYSLEAQAAGTRLVRWLVLDIRMPAILRPLRSAIVKPFDVENVRTLAALKAYAESQRP